MDPLHSLKSYMIDFITDIIIYCLFNIFFLKAPDMLEVKKMVFEMVIDVVDSI